MSATAVLPQNLASWQDWLMGRIYRSPWKDFPDVIVQTAVARMQAQPGYGAAKRGDSTAAFEVLRPLFKPEKVPWAFDAVIRVLQLDRGHQNAPPAAYASLLATHRSAAM